MQYCFYTNCVETYKELIPNINGVISSEMTELMRMQESIYSIKFVPAENINVNLYNEVEATVKNDKTVIVNFNSKGKSWDILSKTYASRNNYGYAELNNIIDLLPLMRKYANVIFIGKSSVFDESILQSIKLYQLENSPIFANVGLIFADSIEQLSMNIFKNLLYKNLNRFSDLIIAHNELLEASKNEDFYNINESNPLSLDYNLPIDTFNLHGHSREDHIYIQDGFICPISEIQINRDENKRRLPGCAILGECYRPEKIRVSINDIKAKVVFLNSCSSFRLGEGAFEKPYNHLNGLINSWPAVIIGSSLIKDGNSIENLYFYYMLNNGYSVGEIVKTININAWEKKYDFFNLSIYGDPSFSYKDVEPKQILITSLHNETEIDTDTNIISVPYGEEEDLQYYVETVNKEPIYSMIRYEKDVRFIDFFRVNNFKKGEVIKIMSYPQKLHTYILDRALPTLSNLKKAHLFNLNDQKFKNNLKTIENELVNLTKFVNPNEIHLFDLRKVIKKIEAYEDKLKKAERFLLNDVINKTFEQNYQFSESYHETSFLTNSKVNSGICPYCENVIYSTEYTSLVNNSFERKTKKCPTCGVIEDFPNQNFEIELNYNEFVKQGNELLIKININNRNKYSQSFIDAAVLEGKKYGTSQSFITLLERDSENLVGQFKFIIGDKTIPHLHYIRIFLVNNGGIYYLNAPFWVNKNE